MKFKNYCFHGLILGLLILFNACKNEESFENKLFISTNKLERIVNKAGNNEASFEFKVNISRPEPADVTVNVARDESKLSVYSKIYGETVELLPEGYYTFSNKQATISPGAVESSPLTVSFNNITALDRELIFVLPVAISNASIAVLDSESTVFYVIKGGAVIDVVADIEENNLHIDQWNTPAVVNNLKELTLEALIRVRNYDRMISTVMGIEGRFLIRLGDANFPSNQIQVATSSGNMPGADGATKGLPTNEWVHVAVTFNSSAKKIKVYINGKLQSEANTSLHTVNFGVNGVDGFYIGRSYADDRYLAGDISECRIWNVERTVEEIAATPYEVDPQSTGLVAYWKFNDGVGSVVKDHTSNGNDLTAKKAIKWTSVSLPEKK